jgi:hypothetical protein
MEGYQMSFNWKDAEHNCSYYFKTFNGKIVGQVYNIAHTNIWGAKINLANNEEKYLGQYISHEHAKKAIEFYWDLIDKTYESKENLIEN